MDGFFVAAGGAQIIERFVVDGEKSHCRAVFGGHIGDGGAIGDFERGGAVAEKFDELADDFGVAQNLGDGEDEVGGGDAGAQSAFDSHADDIGGEDKNGLA